MLIAGRISGRDALVYICVQCAGAIAGAALLFSIMNGMSGWTLAADGLGQNGFDGASPAGYGMTAALIAEAALTFFFIYAILEVTAKHAHRGFEGLAIGFALFLVHIVGIPITGTSVNPARSLGPALLVQGTALEQLWLFWAAPVAGAFLAAIVWMYLTESSEKTENIRI
jgi:aquaporin Z